MKSLTKFFLFGLLGLTLLAVGPDSVWAQQEGAKPETVAKGSSGWDKIKDLVELAVAAAGEQGNRARVDLVARFGKMQWGWGLVAQYAVASRNRPAMFGLFRACPNPSERMRMLLQLSSLEIEIGVEEENTPVPGQKDLNGVALLGARDRIITSIEIFRQESMAHLDADEHARLHQQILQLEEFLRKMTALAGQGWSKQLEFLQVAQRGPLAHEAPAGLTQEARESILALFYTVVRLSERSPQSTKKGTPGESSSLADRLEPTNFDGPHAPVPEARLRPLRQQALIALVSLLAHPAAYDLTFPCLVQLLDIGSVTGTELERALGKAIIKADKFSAVRLAMMQVFSRKLNGLIQRLPAYGRGRALVIFRLSGALTADELGQQVRLLLAKEATLWRGANPMQRKLLVELVRAWAPAQSDLPAPLFEVGTFVEGRRALATIGEIPESNWFKLFEEQKIWFIVPGVKPEAGLKMPAGINAAARSIMEMAARPTAAGRK